MPRILDKPISEAVASGRSVNAKEAALFLGVSKRMLNEMTLKWSADRRVPSFKYGRKRTYALDELRWWRDKHREPI